MKAILLFLLIALVCLLSSAVRLDIPGFGLTNEGNEFYVGFFRNRFGSVNEQERIDPVLWITTSESTPVSFNVFTIFGLLASGIAIRGEITYIDIPIGLVVVDSSLDSDEQFKGIRIKAENDRRIAVFGHHEEQASNDAYLGLPVVSLPAGRSYEYIAASIRGDEGTAQQAKDSVALIIGTENDTEIIVEIPSTNPVIITYDETTNSQFFPGAPIATRTITIQRFQTLYLQVRGGDISGVRIIANKPISVFSGHECADIPIASQPCDVLIEQLQLIDTWGTEVVTVPLRTRSGDVLKVFASQDSTTVNVAYTDISSGTVTTDSFTLDRNGFRELGGTSTGATGAISDFALIQSNNPIAVFQFSRSFTTDNVIVSDPFMLSVPSCEQYRDSYAVAPAPFNETTIGSVTARVAYVNYTNIAVPAEYFNASLITINNSPANASEFIPIRRANNSIWGYGARLLLDEGAQVIRHQDPNAALSVTIYGLSNQQSWGCTGGTGLGPVAIPRIQCRDVTVIENVGSAIVPCERSGPLGSSVSFSITTRNGNAIAGSDYTTVTQEYTFGASQSTVNINIPIINDDIPELDENFFVTIMPDPANHIILDNEAMITVIDDDDIEVEFSAPIYSTNESTGVLQATLVSTLAVSTNYVVRVRFRPGTASRNEDFDPSSQRIRIPAGQTRVDFTVPIVVDSTFEGNETFNMRLDIPRLPDDLRVVIGAQGTAIGEIIDTDPIIVMFSQTMYSVNEGAGPAQPALVLSRASPTPISVQVTNTDGSATGGVDYGSGPYTVTFPAGETIVPFDIPITDDVIMEMNETFTLTIDPSSLPAGGTVVVGSPDEATVTIVDDDPITVMFNQTMYSVIEGNGPAQPVLVLSNPSSTQFNVTVTSTDGSATGGGDDYGSGPYTVTFPAGETSVLFDIPITDDRILEGDEDFTLTIGPSLPSGVTVGSPGEATVTIVDDDPITVMFNQTLYRVDEDAGPAQPVLVLSNPSATAFNITVTSTDGSATGGGVDYGSGPYIVTFPAGETSVPFDVPIINDVIQEGNENFMLTIDPSLPTGVSVGTPGEARVTIVDDDGIMVMFNQTLYSVSEGAGPAQPVLVLSGPSSMTITVNVTSTDGSATGGDVDYGSGPYTVTFPPGETIVPFDIPITDDGIMEVDEDFTLTIDPPVGGTVVVGSPGQATVTILDDDPITVTFSNRTYSVDEGSGPAQPVLVLSNPSSMNITVEVRDTGGNATSGEDYGPGIYTVVIPAGMTMAPFDIPIIDDVVLEGNEDFDIVIVQRSLPDGVTRGDPGRATVTIVDDDPITINFERPTYSVDEDDGQARPVLVLSNPSAMNFTVRVEDSGNTATGGGVDYGSGPYVIAIPAGETRVPFDVQIINDMILENDEDFDLTIVPGSLPTGVTRGTTGTTTVTIVDNDDVTVRFANRTGSVSESDGLAILTVVREGDADIPVTVTVTTSDGTATAGDDYRSITTTVTIPANQTSVDVMVPLIDDNCREEDETFNGELTVAPGQPSVILGTPDETTITIVDDDVSMVQFINAPYVVSEGRGMYNVCLSITPACDDLRADITLDSRPKDAVPGEDYDVVTRTVTFQPNQMIRCIEMNNIIDDSVREGSECFSLVITVPPGSRLIPGDEANVTILDDEPVVTITGDVRFFNDTVIGDPLYEVPLNMISNGTFPQVTSLCYEIHGEAGQIFNLISDGCVQVNANYSAMDIAENGNIISQIGILAYDNTDSCIEILVDVNDCVPVVNGVPYNNTVYDMNGVSARRRNNRARITVPNCDNRLFDNLVFWVVCQDMGGQKMIKFQVARGSGLIPDSHGLLGQFWNIPVSASDFTGDPLTNDSRVTPYVVRVDHPDDPPRQFVAELFQRTWDKSLKPCLYAGDGQGGRIFDQVTPNDPVIAGTFRDYIVSSMFASDFVYNKLERRNC